MNELAAPHLDFLPLVTPKGTRLVQRTLDGAKYMTGHGMSVIVSAMQELDGRLWLHVSCARQDRLPDWDDIVWVKDVFIGRDRYAYSVIPPKAKHVNIHPHCLHLWHCLDAPDGAVLPDFTRGGSSL